MGEQKDGTVQVTTLLPFQFEGVRAIHQFGGRALLADDMGLGKTIQALYWVLKTPKRRPVVIVSPASMKFTWQAEAALHFGLRAAVLESKNSKTLPKEELLIINYDILADWLKPLLKLRPKMVILDEVHYITNPRAKRSRAVHKLCRNVSSVVGLSGTPFTNRPIELWSVLKAIKPSLFPSRQEYAWTYCKPRWTPWGWKYDGAANTKKLNRLLRQHVMVRRLKTEVARDLPSKQRQSVVFRLSPQQAKEYQEAEQDFLVWLAKKNQARADRAKKSPALTKIGYLLRLVAELKLEFSIQWIKEFFETNPDKKLVAFTMHTFVIERLLKVFPHMLIVDGSVSGRKRFEVVRQFQNNRKSNLLVGNWRAAGVGLTMTAAHNAAALDFPWTPGDLLQGEDRLHRIGQKTDVLIHYLTTFGTIEEKLVRILQRKARVLDAVLNEGLDADELNIFDELLEIMKGTK